MPFPVAAAIGAGVSLAGMAIANGKDKRQLKQQKKLQDLEIEGQRQLLGAESQYDMWEKTGPVGQMAQLKEAKLNPGLIYGMGGAGGQTTGNAGGVTGGRAPAGSGREMEDMIGMGIQGAQLSLLKAQKDNIDADTKNKLAEAGYTGGPKTKNTDMDTTLKNQQQWSLGLDNALKDYMNSTNKDTGETDNDFSQSLRVKEAVNNIKQQDSGLKEVAQKIDNMVKEGKKTDEITENLKKEGALLDAEKQWNEVGLKRGDFGKFILGLIKHLVGGKK